MKDGVLALYHYSPRAGLKVVRPFRSSHTYTPDVGLPVSWFYLRPRKEEYIVEGDYLYSAQVASEDLYNLKSNPLGLPLVNSHDVYEALVFLRRAGYLGVRTKPSSYWVASLFRPIRVMLISKGV